MEFIKLRAIAREVKRRQQEANVAAYFEIIYKNIFKSGMRLPRVSQFMEEISKNSSLQNKVLISRATTDLALPDDQGKLIIIQNPSPLKNDWLLQPDLNEDRLVIKINTNYPAPEEVFTTSTPAGLFIDLTRYEERDVYKTAELLAECGRHLEMYGDRLMTRTQFKRSREQA